MLPYIAVVLAVFVKGSDQQCIPGDVRLVNGTTLQEGRLEICINSNWSTVCSKKWAARDARVVCRQLGYKENAGRGVPGAYFGQGVGDIALDNVTCNGSEPALLNCSHDRIFGHTKSDCNHSQDASVQCILRDNQRIKNITPDAKIINQSPSTVHTFLISWVLYNTTMDEPTSFDVKCSNEQHGITLSVSGQNFTTHLAGLLPSTSYNCCVSAVYELYRSDGVCVKINTPELFINAIARTMTRTFEINVVGGVLGFIVAILLVLLIISGAALAYLLLKRNAIPARLLESTGHGKNDTMNMPVHSNQNYVKPLGTSISTTKTRGVQAAAINQLNDGAGPDYSRLGPDHETINSSKRPQRKNQIPAAVCLSEQYEYSEVHLATLNEESLGSANHEIPLNLRQNVSAENEDYSRLQH